MKISIVAEEAPEERNTGQVNILRNRSDSAKQRPGPRILKTPDLKLPWS